MRSQATIPRCRCFQGSEGDKPTKLITSVRGRWCDFLRRLRKHLLPMRDLSKANGVVSSPFSSPPIITILSLFLYLSVCAVYEKCGEREEDSSRRERRNSKRLL